MIFIGQQLRLKRDARNWKQKCVAQKTGISETALSRMENNQQGVSEEEVEKLAEVFNTTVQDIKNSAAHSVHLLHNNIKGNGYVHQQTNNGAELFQQALIQFQNASQQMMVIIQELKTDKDFLREQNHQLLRRDEKWMQMLMEMQTQLINFLRKDR